MGILAIVRGQSHQAAEHTTLRIFWMFLVDSELRQEFNMKNEKEKESSMPMSAKEKRLWEIILTILRRAAGTKQEN
jgi:uncharacterized protein YfbU (UPF0304 family)